MKTEWQNFGDVNPIEHGGLFVLYDMDIKGRCYYVIQASPFENGKWAIIDGYVDLDDEWIEWDSVKETLDTPENADDECLSADVMNYYGTHLSNGEMEVFNNREDVVKYLLGRGIDSELLNI